MTQILSFFHTKNTDLLSEKSPTLLQPTLSRVAQRRSLKMTQGRPDAMSFFLT
jgi:hypothetical protein